MLWPRENTLHTFSMEKKALFERLSCTPNISSPSYLPHRGHECKGTIYSPRQELQKHITHTHSKSRHCYLLTFPTIVSLLDSHHSHSPNKFYCCLLLPAGRRLAPMAVMAVAATRYHTLLSPTAGQPLCSNTNNETHCIKWYILYVFYTFL